MIVQLKDRQELQVTKEQADKIKTAIESGVVGIEIGDEWFRADYVVRIKVGGTSAEVNEKQLEPLDHRGKPSEAKERLRQMLADKGILKTVDN